MLEFNKYTVERDIANYKIVSSKEYGRINKMFKDNKFGKPNEENFKHFIKRFSDNHKINFDEKFSNIKEDWSNVELDVKDRMEDIFKIKLWRPLNVFLTTNDLASFTYRYKRFFVFVLAENTNYYIIHELFHFYTIEKFKKRLDRMPKEARYIILESMTKILNLEFLDLIGNPELGKPGHDIYRINVSNVWTKTKDIEQVFNSLYAIVPRK